MRHVCRHIHRFMLCMLFVVTYLIGTSAIAQAAESALPKACAESKAVRLICVKKNAGSTATLRMVENGKTLLTLEARTGDAGRPEDFTPEGTHLIYWKHRDHVFHPKPTPDNPKPKPVPMPFSLFFKKTGHAVHFSDNFFARRGNSSNGCVNLRDRTGAERLFEWAQVNDPVIIVGRKG